MEGEAGMLAALEEQMARMHIRGQWQVGANRPENIQKSPDGRNWVEPIPMAKPHLWPWEGMVPILEGACKALPQSYTARRSMIYMNPGLQRGTTQTLLAGLQIIHPGEIAWAHRHTVTALRFTIQGGDNLYTVVDGEPLAMHPYDMILTPNWCWHDHHNEKSEPAIWLDVLDVPFVAGINQNFYEELGETMQDRRNDVTTPESVMYRPLGNGAAGTPTRRPYRYPWSEVRPRLEALAGEVPDPADGIALEYTDPTSGGPALKTISCLVQMLPPGFRGVRHRRSSSAVHFVVEGEGTMEFDDTSFDWTRHDGLAVPNWTWHRMVNRSRTQPAILFTASDRPILDAFGLYREQIDS